MTLNGINGNNQSSNSDLTKGNKLLSIIVASNRPTQMQAFLENINQTLSDKSSVEVLVKIDDGDDVMRALLEKASKSYSYDIRYLQTPKLDGYYTLHLGYQELLAIANPSSYFFQILSEEVRFSHSGWDLELKKFVKLFPDDVYRLKISQLKYRNYYSHHDCGPTPENFPFITRRWMELAGGVGDCWGPDGWHQYIDYHLGLTEGINGIPGLFRGIPIHTIAIHGEAAAQGLTQEQAEKRAHRIFQEWWRMFRVEAQQNFRKIATRMAAHIWAANALMGDYKIVDDIEACSYTLYSEKTGHPVKRMYYYLSATYIMRENFFFLMRMVRKGSVGFQKAFLYPSYGPKTVIKQKVDYLLRGGVIFVARLIARWAPRSESIPFRRIFS